MRALLSGFAAGGVKAFEFGLSKLIVLVIGLFAKLIGLGDLAKRVQKIFKKRSTASRSQNGSSKPESVWTKW